MKIASYRAIYSRHTPNITYNEPLVTSFTYNGHSSEDDIIHIIITLVTYQFQKYRQNWLLKCSVYHQGQFHATLRPIISRTIYQEITSSQNSHYWHFVTYRFIYFATLPLNNVDDAYQHILSEKLIRGNFTTTSSRLHIYWQYRYYEYRVRLINSFSRPQLRWLASYESRRSRHAPPLIQGHARLWATISLYLYYLIAIRRHSSLVSGLPESASHAVSRLPPSHFVITATVILNDWLLYAFVLWILTLHSFHTAAQMLLK
jgi:hypothetical protein